jgi:pimeloyl-ACP methyl ester carboxylesterase
MSHRTGSLSCLTPQGFLRMHYQEWGDPHNPRVVLCLHGLTRNGRDFDVLAAGLAPDFRVLCPDMPGRGQSDYLPDPAGYGYPLYLACTAALIARTGVPGVSIVGTSMGGLIGMMLAAQAGAPLRCLVINDVGPHIPKAALERLSRYVGRGGTVPDVAHYEARLREVCAGFGPLTDAQWRQLAETSCVADPAGGVRSAYDPGIAAAFSGPLADVDLWPVLDRVQVPALVLRGAASDLLLPQTLAEMTRRGPGHCEVAEFAEVGHAPMLMDQAQIAPVRDFLNRHA